MKELRNALIINAVVIGLALVFNLARLLNRRFRIAAASFNATYRFRSGSSSRNLVFTGKKIRTSRNKNTPADFEIEFIDLPGALAYMAKYPNDPITLIMENKIVQTGNLYFLYMLGHLGGLLERGLRRQAGNSGGKK